MSPRTRRVPSRQPRDRNGANSASYAARLTRHANIACWHDGSPGCLTYGTKTSGENGLPKLARADELDRRADHLQVKDARHASAAQPFGFTFGLTDSGPQPHHGAATVADQGIETSRSRKTPPGEVGPGCMRGTNERSECDLTM
jgi:hypothetical protein